MTTALLRRAAAAARLAYEVHRAGLLEGELTRRRDGGLDAPAPWTAVAWEGQSLEALLARSRRSERRWLRILRALHLRQARDVETGIAALGMVGFAFAVLESFLAGADVERERNGGVKRMGEVSMKQYVLKDAWHTVCLGDGPAYRAWLAAVEASNADA